MGFDLRDKKRIRCVSCFTSVCRRARHLSDGAWLAPGACAVEEYDAETRSVGPERAESRARPAVARSTFAAGASRAAPVGSVLAETIFGEACPALSRFENLCRRAARGRNRQRYDARRSVGTGGGSGDRRRLRGLAGLAFRLLAAGPKQIGSNRPGLALGAAMPPGSASSARSSRSSPGMTPRD